MSKKTIWFDLENSPHVLIFRNIFQELKIRGIDLLITARDFAQTYDLLNFWNIDYYPIGMYAGKNKINKIFALLKRANRLKKFIEQNRFARIAVSHGSRSQVLAAQYLKLNSITLLDYEYTENFIFKYFSDYILVPVYIPNNRLISAGFNIKKIIKYNGFKEELFK
jgi:predicted glycosyltransferase